MKSNIYASTPNINVFRNFSSTDIFTIKVFDRNGRRAIMFDTEKGLEDADLTAKMQLLDKGVYILNAFRKGRFIKALRLVVE